RLTPSQPPVDDSPQELLAAVAEKPPKAEPEINLLPNWNHLVDYELESDLLRRVPEIGLSLDQAEEALSKVSKSTPKDELILGPNETVLALLEKTKVEGLPFQTNSDCKLHQMKASALQEYSRNLHRTITRHQARFPNHSDSFSSDPQAQKELQQFGLADAVGTTDYYNKESAVPALVQILQTESPPVRYKLVDMLKSRNTPEATRRLLNRALYDLSQDVRQAANEALKERHPEEFRAELLNALRYPWEPVAWHAAETLIHINDEEAIPALIDLLDAPNPSAPYKNKSGKVMIRELVKVNHLRNCLLCHAQSHDRKDLVAAPVPVPGQRLPQVYYSSFRRSRSVFVRADVTYIRQDFSLVHDVKLQKLERRGEWPERQRFDYFVRTREANPEEISLHKKTSAREKLRYSQREAVLVALRTLTRENLGDDSEEWKPLKTVVRGKPYE
ncbi:MAG: HEAT repeat domain-containing protein, partial [Planctomycetaceae bacterium]|nr:HEAT repeat domain-containing protein [Planctomycetaceae bacterium]